MLDSAERRRERARLAQRRSRAQRKANLEVLQGHILELESSLEQMTQICLGFSDIVISAISSQNYNFLHRSAAPFLRKILQIASRCLDDKDAHRDAGDISDLAMTADALWTTLPESGPHTSETAITGFNSSPLSVIAQTATMQKPLRNVSSEELGAGTNIPNGWPAKRSDLAYGILPEISLFDTFDTDVAPPDITPYIASMNELSFANALFWNTITLAYTAVVQPHSPLMRSMFHYVNQLVVSDVIVSRTQRRLSFRPKQTSKYLVANIHAQDNWCADQDPTILTDPIQVGGASFEAHVMDEMHDKIVQNMKVENDNRSNYLDAIGVQERLSSYWKLAFVDSPMPSLDDQRSSVMRPPMPPHHVSYSWYDSVIWNLAQSSRCLGNSIGFPVEAVDALAFQLHSLKIAA